MRNIGKKVAGGIGVTIGGGELLGEFGPEQIKEKVAGINETVSEQVKEFINYILTHDLSSIIGPDAPFSDIGLLETSLGAILGGGTFLVLDKYGDKIGLDKIGLKDTISKLILVGSVVGSYMSDLKVGAIGLSGLGTKMLSEKILGPKFAFLSKYIGVLASSYVANAYGVIDFGTASKIGVSTGLLYDGIKAWKN